MTAKQFSQRLSNQLSLFNLRELGVEKVDRYSQLIGLYDMCPKGVSRKFKTTTSPHIVHRDFTYSRQGTTAKVSVAINPTLINQETRVANPDFDASIEGSLKTMPIFKEVFMYPSEMENRIEEALIYIASHGDSVDRQNGRIGVYFTLSQLRSVLAQFGSKLNSKQIRLGIEVLRKSVVDVKIETGTEGSLSFNGSRIDGLIIHDRSKWTKNDEIPDNLDLRCFCYLHPLAAYEVSLSGHCLHDLEVYSQIKGDIAKSIYRRLSIRYTYADPNCEYSVMVSDFLKTTDRGLVTSRKDWYEVQCALEQLVDLGILSSFNLEAVYSHANKRKITDKKMTVFASTEFKRFMIKSNSLSPKNRDICLS